ncbi:transposase [Sinorhizobium meliloti CCBAU 01290]|nr:transposase [Sinorhizobium meliloti CCBAU 01290]
MEIDEDKIDDAVLTLLWLTLHNERWTNPLRYAGAGGRSGIQ